MWKRGVWGCEEVWGMKRRGWKSVLGCGRGERKGIWRKGVRKARGDGGCEEVWEESWNSVRG